MQPNLITIVRMRRGEWGRAEVGSRGRHEVVCNALLPNESILDNPKIACESYEYRCHDVVTRFVICMLVLLIF